MPFPKPNGFALLAVLWLVTLVGGALAISLATARLGQQTTRNRMELARGRWAAEACLAILQSRWARGVRQDTDTIDLGRTTACAWRIDDPGTALNVNYASRDELVRLQTTVGVPSDSANLFADAVLRLRSRGVIWDAGRLAMVPGVDARLVGLLTVDGSGAISALRAPRPVLQALPGMSAEAVERLLARRRVARPVRSLDELGGELSSPARATLYANYAYLVNALAFEPRHLVVRAEGWVGTGRREPRAAIELLVVPLPDRLAVLRRVVVQ